MYFWRSIPFNNKQDKKRDYIREKFQERAPNNLTNLLSCLHFLFLSCLWPSGTVNFFNGLFFRVGSGSQWNRGRRRVPLHPYMPVSPSTPATIILHQRGTWLRLKNLLWPAFFFQLFFIFNTTYDRNYILKVIYDSYNCHPAS